MRILYAFLALVFLTLQYQLWFGDAGVRTLGMLREEVAAQRSINNELEGRNRLLEIEVVDLKTGLEAVEERARSELGMIKEDETFYLFVD